MVETAFSRSRAPAIGPKVIDTVQGPMLFVDAPGCSIGAAIRDDADESRVVIMVYDPGLRANDGEPGTGFIVQLDADAAAQVAAALLRNADQIGRKVQ
ncbi:hypothetical protein [Novosphingobium humi]|uniref:Uncharacterized protein n=1 Tax=Novosphingobium humi TaxID=2282397 RepID=A0ABY7TRV3_9SPHN|nr:hypothetical protein [Novosphingobium humi]WCT75931.1 hypothetical protein PQ457_08105 [Novosphingobium humi]